MALTPLSRKIRKQNREYIKTLSRKHILEEYIKQQQSPINEALSGKPYNLDDIEQIIKGEKLPTYIKSSKKVGLYSDDLLLLNLLFLPNKNNNLEGIEYNTLSLFMRRYSDDVASVISGIKKLTYSDFGNFIKKVDADNATADVKTLVEKFDYETIYNEYNKVALEKLKQVAVYTYALFTSGQVIPLRDYRINTLAVSNDAKRNKYIFFYNPKFILEQAINEFLVNNDKYKDLKSCYTYLLAFFIAHEMSHCLSNNITLQGGLNTDDMGLDSGSERIDNIVTDSWINAQVARLLATKSGMLGINPDNANGLYPDGCIDDSLLLRAQHNVGFDKGYTNVKELCEALLKSYEKSTGKAYSLSLSGEARTVDLTPYRGADVVIKLTIPPANNDIREKNTLFQRFCTDFIRTITTGQIYSASYGGLTDEEKATDLDVLANGTLVKVKGDNKQVYIVTGHEEVQTNEYVKETVYSLNIANFDHVETITKEDGSIVKRNIYTDSSKPLGKKLPRKVIRPLLPEELEYFDIPTVKNDKLTQDEIQQKMMQQAMSGQDSSGDSNSGNEKSPKALSVGSIVYLPRKQKFGKIVIINNDGTFTVEEVKELPSKIVDEVEV